MSADMDRHGTFWRLDDDRLLLQGLKEGKTVDELADVLCRRTSAIRSRIIRNMYFLMVQGYSIDALVEMYHVDKDKLQLVIERGECIHDGNQGPRKKRDRE